AIVVEVSDSHGKWREVAKVQETKVETVSLDKLVVKANVGRYGYGVRIRLEGNATLKNQYLRTWFQHNAMAAPHLEPGKNVVTVEVADQSPLEAAPLTLVYRYKDAPQWDGEVKTIEKQVTQK